MPNENPDMIVLGDDDVRIERGPRLKSAKATRDLLNDKQTASHYQLGGPDAYGYPIKEGADFEYLDWGGSDVEGDFAWYLFAKHPLDIEAQQLPNGKPSPYYVPEDQREAVDGQSRSHYTYIFCEMGVYDTKEEAVAEGEKLVGKARKELPKSHLDHLDKALSSPRMNFARSIREAQEG